MPDKDSIRRPILEKRSALSPEILEKAKKAAAEKLLLTEEYIKAKTIMIYMDFRNEVPTGMIIDQILASDKKLVLPLTNQDFCIIPYEIPKTGTVFDCLTISKYGIAEPNPSICKESDLASIDLVVVPGSVFDQYENRMGYGKGCYDKFFSDPLLKAFKLGLAYDFQVLQCIPSEPYDVKMDKILTITTV